MSAESNRTTQTTLIRTVTRASTNHIRPTIATVNSILLCCILGLMGGCGTDQSDNKSSAIVEKQDKNPMEDTVLEHSTLNTLNWSGFYHSILPCKDCSGIETWIQLNDQDNQDTYELIQQYIDESDANNKLGTIKSQGVLHWENNGSIASLMNENEQRKLFIGEGFVELMADNQPSQEDESPYSLQSYQSINAEKEQLLINTATLSEGESNTLSFSGVINYQQPTNEQALSTKADFTIHCTDKTYQMSSASHHSDHFGLGETVKVMDKNSTPIRIVTNGAMEKALQTYCGAQ